MKKNNQAKQWITTGIIIVIIIALIAIFSTQKNPKQEETIKIGAILPLSGVANYYGEMATEGISLAVNKINKNGGIDGKKIEIIYEDSKTDPKEGVSSFYKLVDVNKVDIVISALSSISVPLAPLADDKKTPIIAIMTTARNFMQNNFTFRYQPLTELECEPIIYLFDTKLKNVSNIGIIYLNDELGKDVADYLSEVLGKEGRTVYKESFLVSEKDFRTQIIRLMNKNVEAIYAIGYGSHLENIIKALRSLNYRGEIILPNTATTPTIRKNLGSLLENVYVATPIIYCKHNNSEIESEFKKLATKRGYEVNQYNAMAYDVVYIIKEALENKKSNENLIDALENIPSFTGVLGKIIKNNNGHELAFKLYAGRISNGEIKCLNLKEP